MIDRNKLRTLVIVSVIMVTLGSAVISKKIARENEERAVADINEKVEHHIDEVTVKDKKLVYKDNNVPYEKFIVLDYEYGTNRYIEYGYYWFNSEDEYHTALDELCDIVIKDDSNNLEIQTKSPVKEFSWGNNIMYLNNKKGIVIIK